MGKIVTINNPDLSKIAHGETPYNSSVKVTTYSSLNPPVIANEHQYFNYTDTTTFAGLNVNLSKVISQIKITIPDDLIFDNPNRANVITTNLYKVGYDPRSSNTEISNMDANEYIMYNQLAVIIGNCHTNSDPLVIPYEVTYLEYDVVTGEFVNTYAVVSDLTLNKPSNQQLPWNPAITGLHWVERDPVEVRGALPLYINLTGLNGAGGILTLNRPLIMYTDSKLVNGIYTNLVDADIVTGSEVDLGYQVTRMLYEIPEMEAHFHLWSNSEGYYWFKATDLINYPADMRSASYMTRLIYNPADGRQFDYIPYSSERDFYGFTYDEIYRYLKADQKTNADDLGYISFYFEIGHNDPTFVKDIRAHVHLTADGIITDRTTDEHAHMHIHIHENPEISDEYDDDDSHMDEQVPGQGMSVDNLLSTSYVCDETAIKQFGNWLWDNHISGLENVQTAPIENVLSCKRIPFAVSGDDAEIICGNLQTGVGYDAGTSSYNGRVKIADSGHYQLIGEIDIPTYKKDFKDMQNNISIYLPYCGIQTIPTGMCFKQVKNSVGAPHLKGRKLKVEYYFDIIYGTCCAVLSMDGTMFAVYNGECGIDIPVTASNRASNELALAKMGGNVMASTISNGVTSAISGFINGGLVGAAVGGLLGAGGSYLSGNLQGQNEKKYMDTHYTTSGSFSSQIASFLTRTVTLIIERCVYTRPSSYAHDNGYPCNLTKSLSELKGYTEIDGACEIKNIPCFEEERRALKQALMQGFYL